MSISYYSPGATMGTPPISPTGTPPISPQKSAFSPAKAKKQCFFSIDDIDQKIEAMTQNLPVFKSQFETPHAFHQISFIFPKSEKSPKNYSNLFKPKYSSFLEPKISRKAVPLVRKGDFHRIWKYEFEGETFCIKTIKMYESTNDKPHCVFKLIETIEMTLSAYEKYKDLKSPYFRMVKMINHENVLKDGYYLYEFIKGKEAVAKDLKDYFLKLIQDPIKYYMPDFRPANVITPDDDNTIISPREILPVIIDPSLDNSNWESFDYEDFSESPQKNLSRWNDFSNHIVHQLVNWFPDIKKRDMLLAEFDKLPFTIPNTKVFFEQIKKKLMNHKHYK